MWGSTQYEQKGGPSVPLFYESTAFVNCRFDEKESFMDAWGWHRVDRIDLFCQWFSIVLLTN
jgi:hypothetical protein